MLSSAHAKRLNAIAITEHVNESSSWFPQFAEEVKSERKKYRDLDVYYGAEIAAADYRGHLKAEPTRLNAELVLGVVHRYPKPDGDGFWNFTELKREDAVDLEIRALKGLVTNPHVNVLGHPGGTAFKKFGSFPVEWLEDVFCMARDNGMAVELNTKYLWDLPGMVALLQRVNPLVSFGSDAHQASDVGSNFATLVGDYAKQIPAL